MLEMKSLQEEPVEGFKITLVDEADLYNWEVAIFGPPNTHYEGGYFKVRRERKTISPDTSDSSLKHTQHINQANQCTCIANIHKSSLAHGAEQGVDIFCPQPSTRVRKKKNKFNKKQKSEILQVQ